MNDQTIAIELKPIIYAYHHGYRVVAKAHNVSQQVVEKLVLSNHHLYFTNRQQDEEIRPLKFRFFPLAVEVNEQKEKCYVLARLEPRLDVVSHAGLVSATQFYVIDGPNCKIFEDELQTNAAFLMAKIPFLNFNLDKLARNEVAALSPTRLNIDAGAIDRQLQELPANPILPELRALFTAEVIEAMEKRQKIFVYSKKFTDSVAIFNLYCRAFFTAQLKYYRKSCAFSTAELTTAISDYDLVFLHAACGDEITPRWSGVKIISLDNAESGRNALWYLEDEKLPEYYRLLSERIVKPSYAAIEKLKSYCDFLLNTNETTPVEEFASRVNELLSFGEALDGVVICNDLLNVLKNTIELARTTADNPSAKVAALRAAFEVFYKISSGSIQRDEWPSHLLEPLAQLVIDWLELLIKNRMTWPEISPIIEEAINDLTVCASSLKKEILQRILAENVGIGCVLDEKQIDQPGLLFKAWSSLLSACTGENKVDLDGSLIHERIWKQHICEIIARLNLEKYAEPTFSLPLRTLCVKLSELYIEKERTKTLFYEMWRDISDRQLEKTSTMLLLAFYARNEFTPNDYKFIFENNASRLEAFIDRIMRALMEPHDKSTEADYRYHEKLIFKFVLRLSALAAQPSRFEPSPFCGEIQVLVRDNFIFTGKYSALRPEQHFRFWENVEEAVATGIGEFRKYLTFPNIIPIQKEFLNNLNLIENHDYRRLRVNDLFFVLEMPEFANRFEKLAPEAKKAFYDNLCGFIDAAEIIQKLKRSILPVLWSYLQQTPKGCEPYADKCFEKMMQFVENNTFGFEINFPKLCREIENIPCNSISRKLRFIETEEGMYIRQCDHEQYLLQLAAATQDRPERIERLLSSLMKMMRPAHVDGRFTEIIRKYYLPSLSDSSGLKKKAWEAEFSRLSKK